MAALIALVVVAAVVVGLWQFAEERRRARESGAPRRAGTAAVRAGLLEMQNLLEPERKVDVARDLERKADLLVELNDEGEPKESGRASGSRQED